MATEGINGPLNPNSVGPRTTDSATTRKVTNDHGSGGSSAAAANSGDHATITSAASQLQQIAAAVERAPDVDTKRVEAIKQAIASGDFEINADRVAEKMIALDTALNRSGQS